VSNQVTDFLSSFHDDHRNTRERTVAVLGEDGALAFESHMDVAIELSHAVEEQEGETAFQNSLVALFLLSLVKDIRGMEWDFLHGRYEEVGRTMRVLAEKMARAFFIDAYARMCPDAPDHPGTTNAEKLNWYEVNERNLSGREMTALGGMLLISGTHQELRNLFKPLWERMHAVAHPSAKQIRSGFAASLRHLFNHFDEALARQLLDDAGEVFAITWGMVMALFPKIMPGLAAQPDLFKHSPKARLWLRGTAETAQDDKSRR
jgi:hypothetical protein